MNVILISPGFPAEMPLFTRGLARVGARVFGVGEGPAAGLPDDAREALSGYLQVRRLFDEEATVREIREWVGGHSIDRVECLWEPGVELAAKLRASLGIPGMSVEQAYAFRDKERMKEVLDAAGIRTPHHARARTTDEVREAAERIGYPLIIKPIAGAGSADTYPIRDAEELEQGVELTRHVPEVSVEEYIEGEEFTFDTICANGDVLFHNIAWYQPKPLLMRLNPSLTPRTVVLRDTGIDEVVGGRDMGLAVLRALGFGSGFTHMEWFRTPKGEVVFGEIGARAPGARLVHAMNYSCDTDLFTGWAEAVCYGRLSQPTEKRYNVVLVFKRAKGNGRVRGYPGLDAVLSECGEHIVVVDLTPVGEPRRDWKKSVIGDGWLVGRHPNLETAFEIGDRLANGFDVVAK